MVVSVNSAAAPTALSDLVRALPEIYQPIFDHPELSMRVSRGCDDRLVYIARIYLALAHKMQRPLRVLDLGCAQGFFSMSLARLGATVHGVDFLGLNINVCNAITAEHPTLDATFHTGRVEEAIERIQPGQFDLVLGLSVFHHIAHSSGAATAQKLLTTLGQKTAAAIFEMALNSEPPGWAASQPENPRYLLDGYAFVHELVRLPTHLSTIARPLYFASNRYWFLNDKIGSFDSWKNESHRFTNNGSRGTRRYYFGEGLVVKLFTLDDQKCSKPNLREYANEAAFLENPAPGFTVAQLILHGQNDRETWLARAYIPGALLVDVIHAREPYDAAAIINDTLDQLTQLEAAGLYHNDVRVWNVILGMDGRATLFDYGGIDATKRDCVWPFDPFLSFMIFVHEVVSGDIHVPYPIRRPALNPEMLPDPYRAAFWEMLDESPAQWSFAFLRERLAKSAGAFEPTNREGVATTMAAMHQACNTYHEELMHWRLRATQAEAQIKKMQQAMPAPQTAAAPAAAQIHLSDFWRSK